MILAAGVAAQAASALANAMQNKAKPGSSGGSASTDFQNLTADIDAMLPGASSTANAAPGSGTGSVGSDLLSLGSDLLGSLGLGAPAASPSAAMQAYNATSTLAA